MRLKLALLLVALVLLALVAWLYVESEGHMVNYLTWRWRIISRQPTQGVDDYRVVVTKSAHRLEVYESGSRVATYPVAISYHGLAPRRIWADELTPEGEFPIASMQYQSVFGPRQMLLDTSQQSLRHYVDQYGEAGRARLAAWEAAHGPLDTIWEVYEFNAAHPNHPQWNDILIHGGGSDHDWTLGCIALDDAHVIELFDILLRSRQGGIGVVVEIRP